MLCSPRYARKNRSGVLFIFESGSVYYIVIISFSATRFARSWLVIFTENSIHGFSIATKIWRLRCKHNSMRIDIMLPRPASLWNNAMKRVSKIDYRLHRKNFIPQISNVSIRRYHRCNIMSYRDMAMEKCSHSSAGLVRIISRLARNPRRVLAKI